MNSAPVLKRFASEGDNEVREMLRNCCESGHTQRATGSEKLARTKTLIIASWSLGVVVLSIIGAIAILSFLFQIDAPCLVLKIFSFSVFLLST